MNNLSKNAVVNYMQPPEKEGAAPKLKKAVVLEIVDASTIRLDHSEKRDKSNTALASYSEDHSVPNTWHWPKPEPEPTAATKAA